MDLFAIASVGGDGNDTPPSEPSAVWIEPAVSDAPSINKEYPMLEVVAALICMDDRFLACQRPEWKSRGLQWEFPGGKVEKGESGEEALIRECQEELAITLNVEKAVTDVVYRYPDLTVHLTLYRAVITAGEPQRLEHNEIQWMTLEEAKGYPFCPADTIFLERLQAI